MKPTQRASRFQLFGTLAFQILLIAPAVFAQGRPPVTFFNTNTIVINDSTNPPTVATPYPSTIVVAGLTGQVITKVTVTLSNLTHSFPSDIYALLVGPEGQMMFLMANVGGQNKLGVSVTNITLTLDDEAPTPLPLDTNLVTGTFQPNKFHPTNNFDLPPPAPAGNSNAPPLLGVFTNTEPDGTWSLFVVDDVSADSGAISNGWSLTISTTPVLLSIVRAQTNVVLSWTNAAVGYTLQTTPSLKPPVTWSNVVPDAVNFLGRLTVTNPISGTNRFYRLIK
jgi:subtilisin-like proprotein convertase family protein